MVIVVTPCRRLSDITPETERSLQALERLGLRVVRAASQWLLEDLRSVILQQAADGGADVVWMIDSDAVLEDPGAAAEHMLGWDVQRPGVRAALFPRSGGDGSVPVVPELTSIPAEPFPVQWIGGACLAISTATARKLAETMPTFTAPNGTRYHEFFGRLKATRPDGTHERMSEIYSLCERCRRAGIPVIADPRVRVGHVNHRTGETMWISSSVGTTGVQAA